MPSPPNILQPAPRVMYSSLPYTPSNLGFYYDLMQNSVHAGSQTTPYMPNVPDSTVSPSTYLPMHTNTTHTAHIPYVLSNPTVCLSPQATFDLFDMEHSVASGSSSTPQHANQYTPCMSSGDVPSSSVEHDTQSIGGYQSTTGAGEFSSHSASCFPQDLHSIPMNYAPRHNVHVGCQASLSPPAMEVKEQKKLSLPTFDPK